MTQPLSFASKPSPQTVAPSESASVLLGPSPAMAHLWMQIRRVAPHLRGALLTGEANCGQEAVARLLHELSANRQRPFIFLPAAEVDARLLRPATFASLPQDAFIFLPDLEQLSREGQSSLLHLMRFRRGRAFSVVAATVADLSTLIGTGQLLPELAEMLGTLRLALPSLRQRKEDLPMLLTHYLSIACAQQNRPMPQIGREFLREAQQYAWSGNLSDLAEVVKQIASTTHTKELGPKDLATCLPKWDSLGTPENSSFARLVSLDTILQEHIHAVLRACHGNKQKASEVLGISRSTLYRMLDAPTAARALHLAS